MIDTEISKIFDRRSALFLTTGMILTSALVMRMLQMQVFNYRDYRKKSENNSFRIQINMPALQRYILSVIGGWKISTMRSNKMIKNHGLHSLGESMKYEFTQNIEST